MYLHCQHYGRAVADCDPKNGHSLHVLRNEHAEKMNQNFNCYPQHACFFGFIACRLFSSRVLTYLSALIPCANSCMSWLHPAFSQLFFVPSANAHIIMQVSVFFSDPFVDLTDPETIPYPQFTLPHERLFYGGRIRLTAIIVPFPLVEDEASNRACHFGSGWFTLPAVTGFAVSYTRKWKVINDTNTLAWPAMTIMVRMAVWDHFSVLPNMGRKKAEQGSYFTIYNRIVATMKAARLLPTSSAVRMRVVPHKTPSTVLPTRLKIICPRVWRLNLDYIKRAVAPSKDVTANATPLEE